MSTKSKIAISGFYQTDLFDPEEFPEHTGESSEHARSQTRKFLNPDPSQIHIGGVPLRRYLVEAGVNAPLIVSEMLKELNWSAFESGYASTGRPPYAPEKMMGLILYGVMQGRTSLRALELLARTDVGAMWVSGGIAPDHANIGRFINMHDESITGEFFESLTRAVLNKTRSSADRLAGDGTTIEAASSHYKLLKEESLQLAISKTKENISKKHSHRPEAEIALTKLTEANKVVQERKSAAKAKGKGLKKSLAINPEEPEAVVQKAKRGRGFAASYKPSVLANEKRVVVAQALDPTSETKVVEQMLDQSERTSKTKAKDLLLDAGYFHDDVIGLAIDRDINLLCPESSASGQPRNSKKFPKSQFDYDELKDHYVCPAGSKLIPVSTVKNSAKTKGHTIYGAAPCESCSMKEQCTTRKDGRKIKRYEADAARDALRQVMRQRGAKKDFSKRKAMVEPVFSHLREVQGLKRFRRKGLAGVKREFGLHLLAYNLSRAVALAFALFLLVLRAKRPQRGWVL